jgi:RND family efflux transporter MFP subunit
LLSPEFPEGASPGLLGETREIARALVELYQARRQSALTGERFHGIREALDLGLLLGESRRFTEAAYRLCNEVAARFADSRVSLAWLDGGNLRLCAGSHAGKVDRRTELGGRLEQMMEEALDQDNEVAWPPLADSPAIHREHERFSKDHDQVLVLSVPVRDGERAAGVLTVERPADWRQWEARDTGLLRLVADLAGTRLADLHRRSGWAGKRAWRGLKAGAAGLLGREAIGAKVVVLALALLVAALAVIPIEHRVRAPFILRTEAATRLSAPFPGHVERVHAVVGDLVKAGDLLVELDRRELLLQKADVEAELNSALREAARLEGEGNLAGFRVARLQADQARAKLAILDHRIGQTEIRAPFDGIVVEGDLDQKLLSPVGAGDLLMRLVQVRELYGQLQVDERDIQLLERGSTGRVAFTGRPDERFRVEISNFEPVAQVREEGTVFLVRAALAGQPEDWWRPGMSGVCKIDAGPRSILWILTRRTVGFLRLRLWL